jgi:cytochrome c6
MDFLQSLRLGRKSLTVMLHLLATSWRLFAKCLSVGLGSLIFWLGIFSNSLADTLPSDSLSADSLPADIHPAASAETAALFELHCAGCHAHGGNIVRRGKTLKQKALVRNGYAETAAIVQLVSAGKGAMPAYADRLSATEVEAIAQYVQQQAAAGW